MKIFIQLLVLTFCVNTLSAQNFIYDDIYKTNKIYFYGYDFTHFKFIEQKRVGKGEEIKGFIFELIDLMNNSKPNYSKFLVKENVIYDQETVTILNTKIKPDEIIGFMKNRIAKDSLQNIVNEYDTKGKSGIGFVQIIECFYRPKKEASVWFVFFDISTKKILDAYENFNVDADSYHGLAAYWGVGLSCGIGQFREYYMRNLKVFKYPDKISAAQRAMQTKTFYDKANSYPKTISDGEHTVVVIESNSYCEKRKVYVENDKIIKYYNDQGNQLSINSSQKIINAQTNIEIILSTGKEKNYNIYFIEDLYKN